MQILLLPRFEDNSTVPCRCLIFNDYKVFCLSKVWAFSIHVGRLSAWLNISIFTLQNIIQTYFRYLESTSKMIFAYHKTWHQIWRLQIPDRNVTWLSRFSMLYLTSPPPACPPEKWKVSFRPKNWEIYLDRLLDSKHDCLLPVSELFVLHPANGRSEIYIKKKFYIRSS